MACRPNLHRILAALVVAALPAMAGCEGWRGFGRPSAQPLGTLSDPVWQAQEHNAEKSDFVVHEHEFVGDQEFLNTAGEDHLKQIAYRLISGQDAQVLVERGRTSARPETEYKYRVHVNSDLDVRRRDVVVRCLVAMGITDADARVVIAPDLAPVYRAGETAASYYETNSGRSGWGGNGGGWGGGGGFGGGYAGSGDSAAPSVARSGGSYQR